MNLPKARTENLVEQNLEKETLIYDLLIDKAFNLNQTSTIIYKACGQNKTFDQLKRKHKFTDDFIYLALDELKRNNLLADEDYISPFATTNRREVIKKVGLASMFVLPIISGLVAPKAANAGSNTAPDARTGGYGESCSGGCIQGPGNLRTTCVNDTCCSYGSDNSRSDGSSFEIETCGSLADDCSTGMASRQCCSGSSSGTCTVLHSPDDLNEDGLTQCFFTQNGEQYSQYSYRLSCSCTCDTFNSF